MNKTQYVKDCLLRHPCLIPRLLKNPSFDSKITKGILYNMIPFRSSIEIECITSLSRVLNIHDFDTIKRRYDIFEYSDDHLKLKSKNVCEHRISIINYSQASGLYKTLYDMKKHCKLNLSSGIHIHINVYKIANSKFLNKKINYDKTKDFLTKKLDTLENIFGKYEGTYNEKRVNFESKRSWINIRFERLHTIEFRIAPMTFEYETIIKWIVECNKIVKELYHELNVSYK